MRKLALIAALVLLSSCGDKVSDEDRAAQDARDVAAVEAMNAADPPSQPIKPQVITYPVIEQYGLFGAGCSFAPGDSIGAIFVAMDDTAYIYVDGELERMGSDPGSAERPMGTRAEYDGKTYSASVEMDEDAATQAGMETINYPGSVTIRDAQDRVVYQESGTVQCGA